MIKIVYAFFVGILLAIFVAVGIDTFYAAPKAPEYPNELTLSSAEKTGQTQTEAELEKQRQFDKDMKAYDEKMKPYNRNVSIVVLIFAIIFLSVGLIFDKKLGVIADGILLGGIFSLLYSLGRSFAAQDSKYSFIVVSIGLVIAFALGYLRLIKPHQEAEALQKSKKA